MSTEGARENNERIFIGGGVEGNRRECVSSCNWILIGNYARHVRRY